MTLYDIALLISAGLVAGAVNALAGGGTIFTFSALLASGLPPVIANATSSVAVLPGQLASAFAYRAEIREGFRRLMPFAVASAIGGTLGAILLLSTDPSIFSGLVPWLILFATLLFIAGPRIAKLGEAMSARRGKPGAGPGRTLIQGVVAVYGGYFGAGMGIMMLATLSLSEGRDFHRLNAAKNYLSSIMQSLAVVTFIASGAVDWLSVLVVAGATLVGGWTSATVGRLIPQPYIRAFVMVFGLGLSAYYFAT